MTRSKIQFMKYHRSVVLGAVTLATAAACAASGVGKWPGTVDSWLVGGPWPSYQGDGAGR